MKKLFLIILLLIFPIYLFGQMQPEVKTAETPKQKSIGYGLVVDNSGSFQTVFETVLKSAKTVVNANGENDEAFTIGFVSSEKIRLYQDFTQDKAKLNRGIEQMYVSGGATTIWDAVLLAAKHLTEKSKTVESRQKYLVLITDGEDRASQTSLKNLLKYLKGKQIQVFALGLIKDLSDDSFMGKSSVKKMAKESLETLTKETGGKIFFVDKKIKIESATDDLIKAIHN